MERLGIVGHVVEAGGYFWIIYKTRRIFCHIANWTELELPQTGDPVIFEVGPANKPPHRIQAINVLPVIAVQPVQSINKVGGAN